MEKKSKIKSVQGRSATQERYTIGADEVAKVAGLIRRGNTFSLRRRIPSDLVKALGRVEVWVALGTSDHKAAAKEARLASVRLDLQWEQQRQALQRGEKISPDDRLSEEDLRRAVKGKFWQWEQKAQIVVADAEDRESVEREIGGLEARDPSAEATLLTQARALIAESKLNIELPVDTATGKAAEAFTASPELVRLLNLLRRADVERLNRLLDRMDGKHGDLSHDPLFAGVNSVSSTPAIADGITLGESITRMGNDPTRAHLGDTADAKYVMTFRAMKEIIGPDRKLASITRAECAEVQEMIASIPPNVANLKPYAACKTMREMAALAAERGDRLMSSGNVRVYTHTQSAFFNWAMRKGLLAVNPATGLAPAKGTAEVSKRPFTIEEMNTIVSGLGDWSQEGVLTGRWWVPLIAIFSGMRLGEIVSLNVQDVAIRDGVECFILRRTEERSLKTEGSERVVPVHPELARLGLLQRVAKLRDDGFTKLFPDLKGETQEKRSDLFQRRFAYFQKVVLGLNERGVSFHSFRHGFRDALREAGVPIDATRALGGWARSGGVEERYGQGTRPSTLAKWMATVKYDGLHLEFNSPGSMSVQAP